MFPPLPQLSFPGHLSIGMTSHLRLTIGLVLTAIVGLLSGSGCRVLDGMAAWRAPAAVERLGASLKALRADLWKPNTAWSPLHELPEVPVSDPDVPITRWSHPQISEALKGAESDGWIAPGARHEVELAMRRGRIEPGDPGINAWFAALAKVDDLPGWNAAILWSHYDPGAARVSVETLARLVNHPPKYVPDEVEPEAAKPDFTKKSLPKSDTRSKPASPHRSPAPIEISPNMRLAAVEAWCLVLESSKAEATVALAPAGRVLLDGKLPANVENELRRSIARRVRPDRIPGLAGALEDPDQQSPRTIDARRAAAEACVVHAVQRRLRGDFPATAMPAAPVPAGSDVEGLAAGVEEDSPWPVAFWNLRNDRDPRLRRRLGELVAVIRHPAALAVLKGQLADIDTGVREATLLELGILGTDEAFAELLTQAKRPEERPRELSVLGLACQGPAALARFTSDKSPKVRAEAARAVRRRPGATASRLLRDLLTDASLEVQLAAIQSVRDWPETLATPLLLDSLAASAFKTRQAALKQLEERRGGGLAFPLFAGPQERALRVAQLTRDWVIPDAAVERVHELTRQGSPLLDQVRLADFREKLDAAGPSSSPEALARIAEWSGELNPADAPLMERLLDEADAQQADVLLHHVLPRLAPAYAALVQLESVDVAVRREGASQLGRIGSEASLSPAICRRLHELLRSEQDNLVWRLSMLGVYRDGSDEAGRLALLAVNHHWPDVRVLGCEYVGRHGISEQALWLLPLFYDANKAVQLAAVTAAGKCHNPVVLDGLPANGDAAPLRGLRPLLTESQRQLPFAVVASMSRLGDPQAMQELARLALDANSTSRLDVVQTMGETGQTRFVEPLIRLSWTEPNHHIRQAALTNLGRLVPSAEQPPALARARSVAEAVEIWAAWWEDRQTKRART
jgi:HEAT repeat protein